MAVLARRQFSIYGRCHCSETFKLTLISALSFRVCISLLTNISALPINYTGNNLDLPTSTKFRNSNLRNKFSFVCSTVRLYSKKFWPTAQESVRGDSWANYELNSHCRLLGISYPTLIILCSQHNRRALERQSRDYDPLVDKLFYTKWV